MSKIGTYLSETKNELLNKVSWPTWPELQSSAIVVMVSSVIIALIVFGMDFVFEVLIIVLDTSFVLGRSKIESEFTIKSGDSVFIAATNFFSTYLD